MTTENVVDREVLKTQIVGANLEKAIIGLSYATDESEAHSRELIVTLWKDGATTASLRQRGSDYPPETYDSIRAIVTIPRVSVYDHYDPEVAREAGIAEEDIQHDAIENYLSNTSLDDVLNRNIDISTLEDGEQ